jgi:hypothetical protein
MHNSLENQEKFRPKTRIMLRKAGFDAIKDFLERSDSSSVTSGVKRGCSNLIE